MNIAIYTRKSIFSDKSDSTESQYNMCKDYAEKNFDNITSIVKYEDEGYTGANIDRPGFSNLMNDVLNENIDILICYKIDRISRNVLDFSSTFDTLQKNNVAFISVKEQIDTSTPLGRAMMYIASVFAQMERETIAERVKDNMIELAKSGKWAGGKPPVGYKLEKRIINGKSHSILVKNTDELSFLYLIFDKFLEGNTLNGMATFFKNNNIKSINNMYLASSVLHNILKNPHYVQATTEIYDYFENLGCIMASPKSEYDGKHALVVYGRTTGGKKKKHVMNGPDKWIISIGRHEPLIDSEKWLKVQARFGHNKIDKTRKHEIGLLKGILKCKCGYSIRVQHKVDRQYNKIYDNYFCQNRNTRGTEYCDMSMVSVEKIDNALLKTLKDISINKKLIYNYITNCNAGNTARSRNEIQKDIKNAERKIENLTSALQESLNSSASKYIISEIEKFDKQIIGFNFELREVELYNKSIKDQELELDTTYDKICNLLSNIERLDYNSINLFLKEIIKECVWDGVKLHISI